MKGIVAIILFSLSTIFSFGQTNPDVIVGKWITEAGNCIVEVYKQNSEYKGRIVWFKDGGKKPMNSWTDEKNPDPNLRNRKLIGMEVLRKLHYDEKEKQWINGKIYDATSGKEWDAVVWLTNNNLLKVKGYWLFRWISQTKTFKKIP